MEEIAVFNLKTEKTRTYNGNTQQYKKEFDAFVKYVYDFYGDDDEKFNHKYKSLYNTFFNAPVSYESIIKYTKQYIKYKNWMLEPVYFSSSDREFIRDILLYELDNEDLKELEYNLKYYINFKRHEKLIRLKNNK